MVMIISTSLLASSAMLAAAVAPASTRPATALWERSDTVSSCPALSRFRAIGPPMLPSPIKPIFMWLPRCCCQAVGRAVHAVRGGGAALPPLCGSPVCGRKGCSRGRALHAIRSGGAAPTPLCGSLARGRKGCSLGVLCTPFAAGALLLHTAVGPCPRGERAVPWACFARRSQRGRCSYRPLWEPRPRGEWRAARARSVVLEVRLALLDERLHALGLVGGGEDRVEHPTLEAHAFGQTGLEYAVDAFLGHHHARQRLAGDDLGGFQGFFQQLVDREDPGYQAGLFGFPGIHLAAGQAHFHGLGLADGAGQTLGAADTRQHAEVDFRLAEAGVVGGIDEVADHRQFTTATQGVTGHSGDQRLAAVGNAVGGG